MKKHSTNLLFLYIVLALMAAGILFMVGAMPVESKGRPTPVPVCRPGVEGIDYCGDRLATSVARPGQRNVPQRATPTRRAK